MRVSDARAESGFTMLATVFAMSIVMLLAVVAVSAVNGDNSLARRDLDQKRAFEAAKAGIDDYAYHLTANPGYWAECTEVPTPNAVNQMGSTTRRRAVPGETGATYAIELIPATGQKECRSAKTAGAEAAATSMLETEQLSHSFRIRSQGYSGEAKASVVATFQPPSFLDYVYFTQRETLDPIAYGFPNPSRELTAAEKQCSLTYQQGRNSKAFYNGEYCSVISFVTGDVIKGPLRSNDAIAINGNPVFGRGPQDEVELSASSPGWYATSTGSKPTFNGPFKTSQPVFEPPESNSQLETIAQPAFRYSGQVRICLNGGSMTVGNKGTCTGLYSGAIPSNGVVYVANASEACEELYSPFTAEYPETSNCGNAYVSGSYSGSLTIAAENNLIINGSLVRTNETGNLGLIANNFIRLYHPCTRGVNGAGSLESPTIDAALLALDHSVIVDHYDCGASLGTINLEGAIAQKYRGPVGTSGSSGTGYLKNYEYDDRLQYQEPPYFLKPETESWVIGRETAG